MPLQLPPKTPEQHAADSLESPSIAKIKTAFDQAINGTMPQDIKEEEIVHNHEDTPQLDSINEDPVEIQRMLKEKENEKRQLISEGVKKLTGASSLEQYIETTDDLIQLLTERTAFASAKSLQTKELVDANFLQGLFNGEMGTRLEKKLNIKLVEFAVRHVKERLSRMDLAYGFAQSHRSILHTALTKDEIIDFLKDIDGADLHAQYGSSFVPLRLGASSCFRVVQDSLVGSWTSNLARPWDSDEMNIKRIAVFSEYLAYRIQDLNLLFESCLIRSDCELLQALFDFGYQDPVLSANVDDELEESDQENLISQQMDRQTALINLLKSQSINQHGHCYRDYYELKGTIGLLITNNYLQLEICGVQSSHDLIIKEFIPDHDVIQNILESSQLEDDLKKALTNVLNIPEFQIIKEKYFDGLGI